MLAETVRRAGRPVRAAVGLIALMLLVLLVGTCYVAWQDYRTALERGHARAESAVRAVEEHVQWQIQAAVQVINRVVDAIDFAPQMITRGAVGNLGAVLKRLPPETEILVFDAKGDAILESAPHEKPLRVASSEYFRAHATGAEWHIGSFFVGPETGRKLFTVSRRLEREGAFAGVVVATIPVDRISSFHQALSLGPQSSIGIIRDDGWLVAHHPQPDATMNVGKSPLFTEHLPKAPAGTYDSAFSPTDGIARIIAYRRVDGLPLIALVGLARDEALAEFWSRVLPTTSVAAAVFSVLAFLAAWVVALLRQDERTHNELAAALRQKEVLLREVHHRVKNNMQVISSLVHLQDGSPRGKLDTMRRIKAMALVHEQIYGGDQFAKVDLRQYVRALCTRLAESHASDIGIVYELDPIDTDIDTALPFALILSEVFTNALKHAFPDGREGSITVWLKRIDGTRAQLSVSDDGVGLPPHHEGATGGLGFKLINALAQQIDGTYEFESGRGVRFALSFPVKSSAALARAGEASAAAV